MNNTILQLKIKQRLNKLASNDYDNIECWQVVEAFNKAQIEWVRRQIRDYDESSNIKVTDLQLLLTEINYNLFDEGLYFRSTTDLPDNYLSHKRMDLFATNHCCKDKRSITVYLVEEDNVSILLRDSLKQPSFEWGETFGTLFNNRLRVYHNEQFDSESLKLTYYRKPVNIEVEGCSNPAEENVSAANIECEFKDDITELIIDEAAAIIAGDIESMNQLSRELSSAERNN